ncbi:4Fe-4S dicluster domain-containing protein [Dendrosporobacter sp. 1207_IL3150]|uniref:4Fe-4S dicluster domain-containing protein n=1 Tax=Dendrosporobacter sp. 1207_IL3150 TaxID=3084054 RepID=UPI002FD9A6E1
MKLSVIRILHRFLPVSIFVITIIVFWRHQYPLPSDAVLLLWFSRLDPLLLLAEWRNTGSLPEWFWLPLILIGITMLFGRLFCGWICPVGGLLAQIPSRQHNIDLLYKGRYIWLALVLLVLISGSNWALILTPFHIFTEEFTRMWQGKIPWVLGGMLLTSTLFYPRFWCNNICPTGLLLASLSRIRLFRLFVNNECSNCMVCTKGCHSVAINPSERTISEDCMLCLRCMRNCPKGEIKLSRLEKAKVTSYEMMLSRRQFFKGGVVLTVAGATWPLLTSASSIGVIRPPGAVPETEFLMLCSRCGRCLKVCPAECLVPMPIEYGFTAFLTPRIIPRQAKCELCMLCQEVCPTGAINKVPLEKVKMGTAYLDNKKCLVYTEQKICLLCREQCPAHAIEVDDRDRPYVNSNLCLGCGGCEKGCPLSEAAIVVQPNKDSWRYKDEN